MISAKPIKTLACCLIVAAATLTACKKNNDTVTTFADGNYSGSLIVSAVQSGNKTQTVLPENIAFVAGNYSANNIPASQLAYTDFIPFTGTYELLNQNTALVLHFVPPASLPTFTAPGFMKGQFAITYQADSLILTQNLSDGLSIYQFRLKKIH